MAAFALLDLIAVPIRLEYKNTGFLQGGPSFRFSVPGSSPGRIPLLPLASFTLSSDSPTPLPFCRLQSSMQLCQGQPSHLCQPASIRTPQPYLRRTVSMFQDTRSTYTQLTPPLRLKNSLELWPLSVFDHRHKSNPPECAYPPCVYLLMYHKHVRI